MRLCSLSRWGRSAFTPQAWIRTVWRARVASTTCLGSTAVPVLQPSRPLQGLVPALVLVLVPALVLVLVLGPELVLELELELELEPVRVRVRVRVVA